MQGATEKARSSYKARRLLALFSAQMVRLGSLSVTSPSSFHLGLSITLQSHCSLKLLSTQLPSLLYRQSKVLCLLQPTFIYYLCYALDTCLLRFEVVYLDLVCPISAINVMQAFARSRSVKERILHCSRKASAPHTHQNNARLKTDVILSVDRNTQPQGTLALEPWAHLRARGFQSLGGWPWECCLTSQSLRFLRL